LPHTAPLTSLHHLCPTQSLSTFEAVSLAPSDGVWSVVRVPGSAAALSSALEEAADAAEAGVDNALLTHHLVAAIASPLLAFLLCVDPHPPATDDELAAWCAASLRAGALPALHRLMAAAARRGRGEPDFLVDAASAASALALVAAEPVPAAAPGAGAGGDEGPRWCDDPAVATAFGILLGCLSGAHAWGLALRRARGLRRGALAGRATAPALEARCGAPAPGCARCHDATRPACGGRAV
jgi:hypothetical protein